MSPSVTCRPQEVYMTMASQIREHMPVLCADGNEHGQVDRIDGDYIKLTKDDSGQHHWLQIGRAHV